MLRIYSIALVFQCFAIFEAQIEFGNFDVPHRGQSPSQGSGFSFPGQSFPGQNIPSFPSSSNTGISFGSSGGSSSRPGGRPPSPGRRPPSPGRRPPSPGRRPPSPGRRPPSPGRRPPGFGRPPSSGVRPTGPIISSGGNQQSPRPISPTKQDEGKGCNCRASCPPEFGQLKHGCITDGGSNGVCCISQDTNIRTRVGFSQAGNRKVQMSQNDIEIAFSSGMDEANKIKNDKRRRKQQGQYEARGSPYRAHAFFFQRTENGRRNHEAALALSKATQALAANKNLSPDEAFFDIQQQRIGPRGGFQNICPAPPRLRCDPSDKYRSIDGTCNNIGNPLLGKSETPFGRLVNPLYEDGVMEPRQFSVQRFNLPNPRDVSNTVLLDRNDESNQFTLSLMQWSQFIDHDLDLTPFADMDGEAISCCQNGVPVRDQAEECFNIEIPRDDGFFAPRRQRCMNFVRSMLAPNRGCTLGPAEQMNGITHWIDGSMIYGSTREDFNRVADPSTGFMKTSFSDLPPIDSSIDCEPRTEEARGSCFAAGDSRISEQPALTVMHTLWVREHNRIARELRRINPHWSPREVFFETRRIVIAQVQHITYNEWLPIIIGTGNVRRRGIGALNSGFRPRNSYNSNTDPTISNEFATAGFRFGHSMVQPSYEIPIGGGRFTKVKLRDSFNDPKFLQENPSFVDGFVRALTEQKNQNTDAFITQDLSNHLFQTPNDNFGMDLMSLNIQRGRDHAIGTYAQFREREGLGYPNSFTDLRSTTPENRIQRLQAVYRNVQDIDLFPGGMTENPARGAVLGPTFASIVGDQFERLQKSDRFFYDREGFPGSFTPRQLNEIRKSSLAKIYCDNSKVRAMQPEAFKQANRRKQVDCNRIPGINLEEWRDEIPGRNFPH